MTVRPRGAAFCACAAQAEQSRARRLFEGHWLKGRVAKTEQQWQLSRKKPRKQRSRTQRQRKPALKKAKMQTRAEQAIVEAGETGCRS